MQISTPAQALSFPNESSSLKETAVVEDLGNAAPKKTKPGIFAKLLEGLTSPGSAAKAKKGQNLSELSATNSGQKDALAAFEGNFPESVNGLLNPEGAKKNALFNGQGTKKPANPDFFNEKGGLTGLSAFIEQDSSQTEKLSDDFFMLKGGKTLTRKNFLHEAKLTKEGVLNPFSGKANGKADGLTDGADQNLTNLVKFFGSGEGEEDANGVLKNRQGRGGIEAREGNQWHRAGKNGRETLDFQAFGARETVAGLQLARQEGSPSLGGGEKENSRISEARGRKGRERLNIDFRDLRGGSIHTESGQQAAGQDADASKGIIFNANKPVSAEMEIPVYLRLTGADGDAAGSIKSNAENSLGRGFEDALARELRGGLSTDIVRDAMVIVRNGGEGTIRLSLRPASLGDVKIRLEMAENKITGHIIVESKEALRAFERELPVLEKAFRDSGFSETNLEMSLAQDGWDFGNREQGQEGDFRSFSPVFAASRYEAESEWIDMPDSAETIFPALTGRTSVNLFV